MFYTKCNLNLLKNFRIQYYPEWCNSLVVLTHLIQQQKTNLKLTKLIAIFKGNTFCVKIENLILKINKYFN